MIKISPLKFSLLLSILLVACDFNSNKISNSANTAAHKFQWPLPGIDGVDWVVNQYVDLDNSDGLLDYSGNKAVAAKVYNQHTGIDIDVANFRAMDNDFPIYAAADGVVENFDEKNFDRNMCQNNCGLWNFVSVRHPNGYLSIYGHLKSNSVIVSIGEKVITGQKLAVVGSSGFSSWAHLHFEVKDDSGSIVDPFNKNMWRNPPVYNTSLKLMDFNLQENHIVSVAEVIDPVSDITKTVINKSLGLGLSTAGGESGDKITINVIRPDYSIFDSYTIIFRQTYRHGFWFYNFTLDNSIGTWRIVIILNDSEVQDYTFRVSTKLL